MREKFGTLQWMSQLVFHVLSTFSLCVVFWVKSSAQPFHLLILPLKFPIMSQLPKQVRPYVYFFPSSLMSLSAISSVHQISIHTVSAQAFRNPHLAFWNNPQTCLLPLFSLYVVRPHRFECHHVTPPRRSSVLCLPPCSVQYIQTPSLGIQAYQIHELPGASFPFLPNTLYFNTTSLSICAICYLSGCTMFFHISMTLHHFFKNCLSFHISTWVMQLMLSSGNS